MRESGASTSVGRRRIAACASAIASIASLARQLGDLAEADDLASRSFEIGLPASARRPPPRRRARTSPRCAPRMRSSSTVLGTSSPNDQRRMAGLLAPEAVARTERASPRPRAARARGRLGAGRWRWNAARGAADRARRAAAWAPARGRGGRRALPSARGPRAAAPEAGRARRAPRGGRGRCRRRRPACVRGERAVDRLVREVADTRPRSLRGRAAR